MRDGLFAFKSIDCLQFFSNRDHYTSENMEAAAFNFACGNNDRLEFRIVGAEAYSTAFSSVNPFDHICVI